MSAFDECTLAEVEKLTATCLGGKSMGNDDVDPMMMAGGVMWITALRTNPHLDWVTFKQNTRMGDIKAFSKEMEAENADPTQSPSA